MIKSKIKLDDISIANPEDLIFEISDLKEIALID